MATTDFDHAAPQHTDSDRVLIDRWVIEDAAAWLGHIEDWLLHTDPDPDHGYELAAFLGHSRPGREDTAAAALIGAIGSIAVTLDRLARPDTNPDTEKRTR